MTERISVEVEFFASLRGKTNKESENMALTKGCSLENLCEILKEKYPSAFRVPMNEYVFVVNGKKQDPRRTLLLCDKDNVSVFPLVGGG
ncbi:MAG: MoaD/ThiS family protein [Candidatus Aenigmarchaeota archaeon]|nr:MoaD/ThiS family protein [Candidatus Aenigmarchaeota archaeon]